MRMRFIFGLILSVAAFAVGKYLYKRSGQFFLFNPLLVATVVGIGLLLVADIPYSAYQPGGDFISSFLQPATVAFAIPLYKQRHIIAKYWQKILVILVLGQALSMFALGSLANLLSIDSAITASLITQPATTSIAVPVTETLGGIAGITAAAVVLNAVIVAAIGKTFLKLLNVDDPVISGLALGMVGHTIGASIALERGEEEGAIASVAMVASSVLTVFVAPFIAQVLGLI